MCVYSLSYPSCNAHAPYSYQWPAVQYFFPRYLINGTIFGGEKVIEYKMCVLISIQLLFETFLILRRTERDLIKKMHTVIPRLTSDPANEYFG